MEQYLSVKEPDGGSRRMELTSDRLSLGRSHENDLSYPDDISLSRKHLVLEKTEDRWYVRDLGSKNGTRVNDTLIVDRFRIQPGDRITAGHLVLGLEGPGGPAGGGGIIWDDAPIGAGDTIVASLEGVLSSDATVPGSGGTEGGPGGSAPFSHNAVDALIRAGRELAQHRPLNELFDLILDLSIYAVNAERGVLMTFENGELVPRGFHGERFRVSKAVRDQVINDKSSILIRDVSADDAFKARVSLLGHNIRTVIAVPLQTDVKVIGLVYVDSSSMARRFTANDLNLLTVLANVAAIRIEHERLAEVEQNERILHRDLEQAAEIQASMLPVHPPVIEGLDLAGYNAACRTVGGDYYDFLEFGGNRVGLILGDVAGKGMPAALMMTGLQARVQVMADKDEAPAATVARLDRHISAKCPRNRFITLFYSVMDQATGEMKFCNAGHNPAILVRADGDYTLLKPSGTVLGIFPELGYEDGTETLAAGDMVVMYSDGVTEAVKYGTEEEFGENRLRELVMRHRERSAEEIIRQVNESLEEWTEGAPPDDDITLLVARKV